MNYKELINRYVYAAVKHLPEKAREDIRQELTTLIYDMLEERCKEMPASEKDVRVIFAELGTPQELANNYSPDKDKSLIGPPYYSQYKMFLKLILLAVFAGITIAGMVIMLINTLTEPMSAVQYIQEAAQWIGIILSALVWAFAAVTIAFAIFQRKGISISSNDWEYEKLPRVPERKETVSKAETIFSIAFTVIFLVIMLFAPQIIGGVIPHAGVKQFIPLFDAGAVREAWYYVVVFSLLGIVRDGYAYFVGRYTKKLAMVTGICDLCSAAVVLLWFTGYQIINKSFWMNFGSEKEIISAVFRNFQIFWMFIILFALILDFGNAFYKARKYDKI